VIIREGHFSKIVCSVRGQCPHLHSDWSTEFKPRGIYFETFFVSMSNRTGKTPDTSLKGRCHCGAVSYELPLPPSVDLEGPDVSELYGNSLVAPSKQRFPLRGSRPNQNKWRASHCHCGACRHTVGALMVDWVNIPAKDIAISRNGPTGTYRASNHASREFVRFYPNSVPYWLGSMQSFDH